MSSTDALIQKPVSLRSQIRPLERPTQRPAEGLQGDTNK